MNEQALELTRQFAEITRQSTLHEIVDALIAAVELTEDGEFTEESLARIEALQLTRDQKGEACAVFYQQKTSEACMNKELAAVYDKRAKTRRAEAERLKKYIFDEMMRAGLKELGGPRGKACIEWSPHSVDVLDVGALPEEFKTTHVEVKVERRKLIDALKAGAQIAAARLTRGSHLRFR